MSLEPLLIVFDASATIDHHQYALVRLPVQIVGKDITSVSADIQPVRPKDLGPNNKYFVATLDGRTRGLTPDYAHQIDRNMLIPIAPFEISGRLPLINQIDLPSFLEMKKEFYAQASQHGKELGAYCVHVFAPVLMDPLPDHCNNLFKAYCFAFERKHFGNGDEG
jgi:hypothetical protein